MEYGGCLETNCSFSVLLLVKTPLRQSVPGIIAIIPVVLWDACGVADTNSVLESGRSGFRSRLCHSQVVWPWASGSTSLSLVCQASLLLVSTSWLWGEHGGRCVRKSSSRRPGAQGTLHINNYLFLRVFVHMPVTACNSYLLLCNKSPQEFSSLKPQ